MKSPHHSFEVTFDNVLCTCTFTLSMKYNYTCISYMYLFIVSYTYYVCYVYYVYMCLHVYVYIYIYIYIYLYHIQYILIETVNMIISFIGDSTFRRGYVLFSFFWDCIWISETQMWWKTTQISQAWGAVDYNQVSGCGLLWLHNNCWVVTILIGCIQIWQTNGHIITLHHVALRAYAVLD